MGTVGRSTDDYRHEMQPKPKLLQSLRANLRLRQYSPRTEEAYSAWTRRYVRFHGLCHPCELDTDHVRGFLLHLAQDRFG